jgi:hypothetical protein
VNGDARFAFGPGHGVVLCDGQEARHGELSELVIVTCRENVLFAWT